jgi:DNA end-binding protein Ku
VDTSTDPGRGEAHVARTFWKGSISFGLVEIPVSLRRAVNADELHLTLLDRKDFSPVGYKHYNKQNNREVPWERIVRGYEYEPDEYVVLTDDDLRRANVEATQTIEILEFVALEEIDPVFFDLPYFVEPLKKASKAYALLRETLKDTGKAGICKVVLRTRQHLAALRVRGDVLVLELLRYAHELAEPKDLELPSGSLKKLGVSDQEAKMAERLVEGMTAPWKPDKYRDEYRDDLLALVKRKVKEGKTKTIAAEKPLPRKRHAEVVDLMPLLKQSLAKRAGESASPKARSKAPRRAAGARSRTRRGPHKKSA